MRVVHVITRLILGGAQENTLYNCEDLVHIFGDDVTLITGPAEGPEGDLFERAGSSGLNIRLLPELRRAVRPHSDWTAYRRLVRLIRELHPDVVHTHSSKAGILGRAAAWKLGVPAVIHTIHGLPFHPFEKPWKNRIYIQAERWAGRRCHKIIAVADAMVDQAIAAGVADRAKFVTIYSGMEVEPFLDPPRSRLEVRKQLGVSDSDIVIGKVARLFEFKGHDDVIEAARLLSKDHSRLKFLFVGGGAWRKRLEDKIASAGLADKFLFTGLVPSSRIPELIHAMDVVVHASYREGLARVLPQALIAGKPVVSYDVDGAREVVLPGKTGWLAKCGDPVSLAQGLEKILRSPDLGASLGMTGRQLCTDRFRHDAMTRHIREVYRAVLG